MSLVCYDLGDFSQKIKRYCFRLWCVLVPLFSVTGFQLSHLESRCWLWIVVHCLLECLADI